MKNISSFEIERLRIFLIELKHKDIILKKIIDYLRLSKA